MKQVSTNDLQPGERLARPVISSDGRVLLEALTELTPTLVQVLRGRAVDSVWLEEEPAAPAGVPSQLTFEQTAKPDLGEGVEQEVHRRFARVIEEPLMADMATVAVEVLTARGDQAFTGHRDTSRSGAVSAALTPHKRVLSIRSGLAQVLADPDQLPTVPVIYNRLSAMIDDPRTTVDQVSDVVGSDPVSTSRLLRLVNSPFYGMRGRVTTVSYGVKLLGFEAVRSLVLAITAEGMFKAATGANQDMAERLWYHSIGAGVAARVVARRLGLTDPEQYFVAGLLHDIGKIVLFRCAPEDLQNTLYTAEQKGVSFIEAENEVCGTNHTLIGAMLGAKWGFPPNLVEAASLHHRPEQAKAQPVLTAVVHLADIISRALDIGSGGDPLVPAFNKSARALLDMDASRLTVIMRDVEREYPEVQTMLTAA